MSSVITTIGNYDDAQEIHNEALWSSHEYILAHGTDRVVYLLNDVVYKVDRYSTDSINLYEYVKANQYRPVLPENVRIPEITLYRVEDQTISAMEYIDGDFISNFEGKGPRSMPENLSAFLYDMGFTDQDPNNVILKDDIFYLIDLGD